MGELAVRSTAMWLWQLLADEVNYLGAVTSKVEVLQSELNTLAAFLTDAVKTRRQDALVQIALSEARSLAHDCEDAIETYILKVARHGSTLRWAWILKEAKSVHKIGSEIDDLNRRIAALKTDLVSYGVMGRINQDDNPVPEVSPLRRVYTHEREERVVVGLEHDVEVLAGRLMDPTDRTVIVLSGMGGLGKSTLAAELYDHPEIREGGYFQAFGWAHASQRLQPDQVLRTILYALVDENDHDGRAKIDRDLKVNRAHAALYETMRRIKCLVIVDDIWTSDDWTRIKAAFPLKSAGGSRLILTSRNQDILSSTSNALDQDQVHFHPVKGLDDFHSWELFEKIAFPAATCTDSTKERLGREILAHCKGVPLAIVVVGKALRRKEKIVEWKQMHSDIFVQVDRGCAPYKPYKEVYNVLQVSYDELPSHLKNCFLHFASYPEDHLINTKKLYLLWVGEGIVSKVERDELEEETAERYLYELVNRNMVQVVDKHFTTGRIKTCRLHDLMRDVCIEIATREGFVQSVSCHWTAFFNNVDIKVENYPMSLLTGRDKRLRRLAVNVSIEHQEDEISISSNVSTAPNLRSLLLKSAYHPQRGHQDCKRLVETIINEYPLLRVFDCGEFPVIKGKLPAKVGNLIHLRYLCLANTRVTELPSSIEKLQWLQTLDLRVDYHGSITIPNVLWKMKQLRHLYLPIYRYLEELEVESTAKGAGYLIKGGERESLQLNGLLNLQTLIAIDLDTVKVEGLTNLKRLTTLYGACKANKDALCALLKCSSIKSFLLRVHAQIINEDPLLLASCEVMHQLDIYAEPFPRFHLARPLCLQMLPNSLIYMSIYYIQLDVDPLPVLERLPELVYLHLRKCYNGEKMVCSAGGFPKLLTLGFNGLNNFSKWEVEQGALHKLKNLMIRNCLVREIPDALPSSITAHI